VLTVPEAAERAGKDPETIRRWIRARRLRAEKIGTQWVIEERDLDDVLEDDDEPTWAPPGGWKTSTGEPMPNWVKIRREDRASH
jgi:excisionase family DNA binding protein